MFAVDFLPRRRLRRGLTLFHFGCVQARASRRMWCLAARGPGCGPRTSRAANTWVFAVAECKGTAEVKSRKQKLKNKKARILLESGPLRSELGRWAQHLGGGASFSRMREVFVPIQPLMSFMPNGAWQKGGVCCVHARTQSLIGQRTHERSPDLCGWVGSEGGPGFHDGAFVSNFVEKLAACCSGKLRTVNSLYGAVKPLRQSCLNPLHLAPTRARWYAPLPWKTPPSSAGITRSRCSRPMQKKRSLRACRPRVWSKALRSVCKSHPACGARSNRPGRLVTSWRGRLKRIAKSPRAGLTKPARGPLQRAACCRLSKLFSTWLCKLGAAPTAQGASCCANR